MPAIIVKILHPTNTRGTRVKASWFNKSCTIPYDDAVSELQNVAACARKLIHREGLNGAIDWAWAGTLSGWVFVDTLNAMTLGG
jgi:hypothetical protein